MFFYQFIFENHVYYLYYLPMNYDLDNLDVYSEGAFCL